MGKEETKYISFEEFVRKSGVKESTVRRRYKDIPGITKTDKGFIVIRGTRYPCDLHRYSLKSSAEKRYALLKTISDYRYISHNDLKIDPQQFRDMLKDLLSAGLIQPNNLYNDYGANAYDCSMLGDRLLQQNITAAKTELVKLIAEATGIVIGNIISKIHDVA